MRPRNQAEEAADRSSPIRATPLTSSREEVVVVVEIAVLQPVNPDLLEPPEVPDRLAYMPEVRVVQEEAPDRVLPVQADLPETVRPEAADIPDLVSALRAAAPEVPEERVPHTAETEDTAVVPEASGAAKERRAPEEDIPVEVEPIQAVSEEEVVHTTTEPTNLIRRVLVPDTDMSPSLTAPARPPRHPLRISLFPG